MSVSLAALVAVAVCALAFTGLDALRKGLTQHLRPLPLLVWLSLGQTPLFLAWWLFDQQTPSESAYWLPALASIGLNVAANLAYLEAVRRAPLSLTIPLLAFSPIFAGLLSLLLLGASLTWRQWCGVGLVVIGAFWLTRGAGNDPAPRPADARRHLSGTLLMLLTAFLWAAALPFDKLALGVSTPSWHGLVVNAGVGSATLLALGAAGRGSELVPKKSALRLLILAIGLSGIALGAQLVAMALTWVALVETLKRAIGTVGAVALGWFFFREPFTRAKIGAAVVLAAGVALVLL